MAERRMFSSKIVCSDPFAEMPFSAQSLYIQLNMEADDDGFLNNAKRIVRMIGASENDLIMLFEKRFVLGFDNGVVVIKHWKMNNQIRKDRYTPTQYQDEFNMLEIKADGSYTEKVLDDLDNHFVTNPQPDGNQFGTHLATQYSIGKDRIDKCNNSIDVSDTKSAENKPPKPKKHKYGEYKNVLLTDEELEKLKSEYSDYEERIERLSSYVESTGKSYKSHYATIRNWARKDSEKVQSSPKKQHTNEFESFMNQLSAMRD